MKTHIAGYAFSPTDIGIISERDGTLFTSICDADLQKTGIAQLRREGFAIQGVVRRTARTLQRK